MKLDSVHVTNFRSAEDSEEFGINSATCLVGKNEAGKSAILMALAALNPHDATPAVFDKERDYPRRFLSQYDLKHQDEDAVAITTTWRLEQSEVDGIATAVGAEVVAPDAVTVSRRYGGKVEISLKLNYKAAIEFLYGKFDLDEAERSALGAATTTSELIETLKTIDAPTAKQQELQAYLAKKGHVTAQVQALILSMLPRFMYFSSYDRMAGAIQLEQAKQLIESGQMATEENRGVRLFADFLNYAGVSIDEIASVATYETFNAKLQAASNNITDQILEYWMLTLTE